MSYYKLYEPSKNKQLGFSLVEVLVAMLIAAVAVGGTMLIHAQNLKQVTDNTELNRAELILTNAVARMQTNTTALRAGNYSGNWVAAANASTCVQNPPCAPALWATNHDIPELQAQLFDAGLNTATLTIANRNPATWLVSIQWNAHAADQTVWRAQCGAVVVGKNCVGLEVTVTP